MKYTLLALLVVTFLARASGAAEPSMPYKGWYLGFFAPDYMDVWLETADVTDNRGVTFTGAMSGTVSIRQPEDGSGTPAGWPGPYIRGKGVTLTNIDLPARIFVRWQSLVEPQTYRATLEIPASARQLMREPEQVTCPLRGTVTDYRRFITIGLAPGGVAKLWVNGPCFPITEILRIQAEIEPKGPYQGLSKGRHRPLEPAAKAYIEQHGIPYDSW